MDRSSVAEDLADTHLEPRSYETHNIPGTLEQPRSPSPNSIRAARLAALERRQAAESTTAGATDASKAPTYDAFDENYERRQEFRRMVDPGILRPNKREIAVRSLQTLSTLAQNLLREPGNTKFQSFKPTNSVIKRDLVDPKGALEYAVEMGFRPEVDNFQPYYKFSTRHLNDLHVGAAVLLEAIEIQAEHDRRLAASLKSKKDEEAARVELAKKQFMDDRKSKALRDQREKERALVQAQAKAKAEREAAQSRHDKNSGSP